MWMMLIILFLVLLLFLSCYSTSVLFDLDNIHNDIKRYEIKNKNDIEDLYWINTNNQLTGFNVTAIDSDYFSLHTNPSTLPGFLMGMGVFANKKILKNSILCEYRGKVVDNNDNDKNMMIKENLYISGNNICSMINDCKKLSLSPLNCYNGFSYNAKVIFSGKKMFIVSIRDILKGEEVFFDYNYLDNWDYWKDWKVRNDIIASVSLPMEYIDRYSDDKDIFNSFNYNYGNDNNESIVDAIDSDHFSIFTNKSTLPVEGAGNGVFAKRLIPEKTVICEYRGPIIDSEASLKLPYNDKYFRVDFKNKEYMVLGKGICSMINDCSNAIILLKNNETLVYEESDPSECYDSLSYNAKAVYIGPKIFILTSRNILPGEEIFFSYSWTYWRSNFFKSSTTQEITIHKKY